MTGVKLQTVVCTATQEPLLRALGAALVLRWDEMSDTLQDLLIDQAVATSSADETPPSRLEFESFVRKARTKRLIPPANKVGPADS